MNCNPGGNHRAILKPNGDRNLHLIQPHSRSFMREGMRLS